MIPSADYLRESVRYARALVPGIGSKNILFFSQKLRVSRLRRLPIDRSIDRRCMAVSSIDRSTAYLRVHACTRTCVYVCIFVPACILIRCMPFCACCISLCVAPRHPPRLVGLHASVEFLSCHMGSDRSFDQIFRHVSFFFFCFFSAVLLCILFFTNSHA